MLNQLKRAAAKFRENGLFPLLVGDGLARKNVIAKFARDISLAKSLAKPKNLNLRLSKLIPSLIHRYSLIDL